MGSVRTKKILLVVSLVMCPGLFLCGQDMPEFTYGFANCPQVVEGRPGETLAVSVDCTLTTANNPDPEGVGVIEWGFSIVFEGASYKGASLHGIVVSTVYDDDRNSSTPPLDPYPRDLKNADFHVISPGYTSQVQVRPPGEVPVGFVSYVGLGVGMWLQPTGTQTIARIAVEVEVPETGSDKSVRIVFRDGLFGPGLFPHENMVNCGWTTGYPALGECSFTVKAKEPLSPPTDLVATGGIQQVILAWLAPTAGNLPTGYQVFRGDAKIGDVTAPTTSYVDVDPSLVPGTEYCYTVKSVAGDLTSDPSNVSCGTPEAPGIGPFIRGDCNGDGSVSGEVTDAVFILNYNFIGGEAPPCSAACDVDGDGEFVGMVTDAVYILNFNFLGGVPPPSAPFPGCGLSTVETDMTLGCVTPTPAGKCP